MSKKKKKSNFRLIFSIVAGVFVVAGCVVGFMLYRWIYAPNIAEEYNADYFYVHSNDGYRDVLKRLNVQNVLVNQNSFEWVAEEKNYPRHVKPGRYKIKPGMSNNDLVNMLRAGQQVPLDVTINNIRTKQELAGLLGERLEPDSATFLNVLSSDEILKEYGFSPERAMVLILPNTYEFFWSTSPEQFLSRMAVEFKNFWTEERIQKAQRIGLSQTEVTTLASIVEQETGREDEKAKIAGVYINRLRRDMRLQADPTLLFAVGDFTLKRVLNVHKQIDSPYNTYKYKGLPPGPICVPELSTIDAVLNYEDHNYLYFCAREDFSGYHNFATNYAQHLVNARKYQRALNKRKIYR